MARYIDTNEFEKRIKPYDTNDPVDKALYNFAHNKMLDTSTADVVERKRGKWINDRGLYRCSYCNQLWTEWWVASKPIERMKKESPYCPMCGSYNGEEESENEVV